jgi:glyoxylase-like metal-dependent hydrolase (beta-lactamase superfamily II)
MIISRRHRRPGAGVVLRLALLFAPGLGVAQTTPVDSSLKREKLAEGVYLFSAPSALDKWTATNSVVVINDDDVTVFDSNSRPVTARMVIAEIRKLTPKPVRTLINSHWHLDHWSGNDEYQKAFPGLRIIATAETRRFMSGMTSRFFADGLEAAAARARAALDTAIRTGRRRDGSALTPDARKADEAEIAETAAFGAEVASVRRVLPNLVYRDSLTFWSGSREFRLISVTGDATGSTVLYLPQERILVMGDVLVRPETGDGPPPWTTNSYAITPWLESLRRLDALPADLVVPGQGGVLHGKAYLELTAELFAAILDQVHGALARGIVKQEEVRKQIDVGAIGRRYSPGGGEPDPRFTQLVNALVRKAHQEALDGVVK